MGRGEAAGLGGIAAALGAALDAVACAAVVGPDARVEFVSAPARALLARYGVGVEALGRAEGPLAGRDGRELVARRLAAAGGVAAIVLEERPAGQPALTARERQVLGLVREGLTNAAIGARLEISARTVQKHLRNVYDKLGVRTRAGAVTRGLAS